MGTVNFFKPEDFNDYGVRDFSTDSSVRYNVAIAANTKLKREGRVVYGYSMSHEEAWTIGKGAIDTHKALLINIEPLQACLHPKEKVKISIKEGFEKLEGCMVPMYQNESYVCECGARVEPSGFSEVK